MRNYPTRTKRGNELIVPQHPRIWDIGKPTGERLRRAVAEYRGQHKKAPHIRRAHWHGYWLGPRDGKRKFEYKWLPPIVVGDVEDEEEKKHGQDE
jgi:hypothetical protein